MISAPLDDFAGNRTLREDIEEVGSFEVQAYRFLVISFIACSTVFKKSFHNGSDALPDILVLAK